MSNAINQNKKMIDGLLIIKKISFLIGILFVVHINSGNAQNAWIRKADFGGKARDGAVGFSIGNKGYIGTGNFMKDFWEYDPETGTWTQKADFGGGTRSYAVGFSIGNKGYIGTGYAGVFDKRRDFWEYDPAANTWTKKADFGGKARMQAVGFSVGNKGYIGSGNDALDAEGETKDFWEYDPFTDTWNQRADIGGRSCQRAVGFSIGTKGYIGTGWDKSSNLMKDFWEYDPVNDTWTRKADYGGGGCIEAVGFNIGSKGYIGTGYNDNGTRKDFLEYDPVNDTWTQKADFGGAGRELAVGFSVGSKGYIGTGTDDNYNSHKDFWEYTPEDICLSPGGLKVAHVSDTCAVLTWNITGTGIDKLQVRYRTLGDAAWTKQRKNPDRNRMYIDGLSSNTTYQWQLRSFCAKDTSGWIKGPEFTTTASFGSIAKASVYPNPAKNTVTVNYTAEKGGKYIFEMTNLSGNVLLRKEVNAMQGENRTSLDVSRFFEGVYFINIIKPDNMRERMQLSKE